jgi:hypothetical protein
MVLSTIDVMSRGFDPHTNYFKEYLRAEKNILFSSFSSEGRAPVLCTGGDGFDTHNEYQKNI